MPAMLSEDEGRGRPLPAVLAAALAVAVLLAPGCSRAGADAEGTARQLPIQEIGFDFGVAEAPVQVVEFSDFACIYCKRFHTETFPRIKEQFIETGTMRWKYVTYASGMFKNGLPAAYAAECAGEQELFSEVARQFYERQEEWKGVGEPGPVFEAVVQEAGADIAEYRACLSESRPRTRVQSGQAVAARLGVNGTPFFVVNGQPMVGAQPFEFWQDVIRVLSRSAAPDSGNGSGTRP